MTVEELEGSLQAYEEKIKRRQEEPLEQVLKSKATLKKDGESKCYFRGHGRGYERGRAYARGQSEHGRGVGNNSNNEEKGQPSQRGRGKSRGRGQSYFQRSNERRYDKANVECYKCHRLGHFAWECQDETKDVKGKANLVNDNQEIKESTLLLTIKEQEKDNNNLWYLDNGASNHMCGNKDQFVLMRRCEVIFSLEIHQIFTLKGKEQFSFLPRMMRDRNAKLLAKVVMSKNRMFKLNIKTVEANCLKVHVQDVAWQWHKRYGHLNFGALREFGERKILYGIPSINHPNYLCEACLVEKHARKSFPKETTWRATKPLELVHTDVCGPINPSSLGKSKYFILFIDDFSRKTWIYFLKQKSEAFATFKKFKALVEKESGYEIKALRSDRGVEFTSKEFNHFCAINGIRRPMKVPGMPQQNGVVERKNRTILNMARSMLKEKHIPKEFWAEAVSCAVYLSNRSPTLNVINQTP
ncbi:UNVERIFIED_CONTAM: Retrovirus-related Pol polyprotein from transposon TNT 1-94 [Sesamum latifolium]|uniref:Retrovirus-related Pol polyprotein from transposon TNT 1-94 n=1 Tax=Sesamum latifolium TaxID=2727402 RepID=A0AAW2X3I7_9LAMI